MKKSIIKYFNTLRHLRIEQIVYRLKYKLFPVRKINLSQSSRDVYSWVWVSPMPYEQSAFEDGSVKFLNQAAHMRSSLWNDNSHQKLWLYNLHYLDDLNSTYGSSRTFFHQKLVNRWIDENPPILGNGWEPYPLSLRLVNLVKWSSREGIKTDKIILSILHQAEALYKQLEFHILGNHLFENAKALIFVGCFIKGDLADKFLRKGLSILRRELQEQFLYDGGHYELSPMYHNIMLWSLLDLINLSRISDNAILHELEVDLVEKAVKAISWHQVMSHPDRDVCFFNDSAFGIAPSSEKINKYILSLGLTANKQTIMPIITLTESGFSRLENQSQILFFNHANITPSYQPGHAHADTLSIEWSVLGNRVLVNSGVSMYGVGCERLFQRSTAAHNTVVINKENSSEVWSGFRVAKRASVSLGACSANDNNISVSASHDGYLKQRNKITHKRSIRMSSEKLIIHDEVSGAWDTAEAYFYLHPEMSIINSDLSKLTIELREGLQIEVTCLNGHLLIENATWYPAFGKSIPNKLIKVTFQERALLVTFRLIQV